MITDIMPKKRKRLKSGLGMCVTKCVTTDGRRLTPASFLCFLALPNSNPVSRSFFLLRRPVRWQVSGVFHYYDY